MNNTYLSSFILSNSILERRKFTNRAVEQKLSHLCGEFGYGEKNFLTKYSIVILELVKFFANIFLIYCIHLSLAYVVVSRQPTL